MIDKKVYSDEEIEPRIYRLVTKQEIKLIDIVSTGAMLRQLMDERDEAREARDALIRELQKEQSEREVRSQALSEAEAQAREI